MKPLSARFDFKQMGLLSLFGLSWIWSPWFGTSEALVFPPLAAYPDALFVSRICSLIAFGLVMAAVAIAGERCRSVGSSRSLMIFIVVIGTVGMLAGSLVGLGILPLWWLYAGAIARGLYYATMAISWLEVLIHLDSNLIGAAVSTALVLYAVTGLPIILLGGRLPGLIVAFFALCPALSCIGCVGASKRIETTTPVNQGDAQAPFRTLCVFCVANFLFGMMLGAVLWFFARFDTSASIVAFFITAAILLAVFAFVPGHLGVGVVHRAFSMVFAVGMAVILLLGWLNHSVAILSCSAALAFLILYTVVIFVDTQARFRKPFWRFPGICQVFAALGMMSGVAMSQTVFVDGTSNDIQLVLLAAACVIFIAGAFSPSSRTRLRPWGFSSLIPVESPEELVMRHCGELAEEYNLTSRELEILQQLAVGRSKDEIANTLVISPATAKTHIRNIYTKLGVHSQRELDARIER